MRKFLFALSAPLAIWLSPSMVWGQHDMHGGHDMPGMSHDADDIDAERVHAMIGMYGPYEMSRESSGTAWQPDSTPHQGIHLMPDDWSVMVHGFVNGIYDHQGGSRGDDKAFSSSMGMVMAQRPLGPGTLGLRGMISLDPLMGKNGYPLLLATGETADGQTHLVDRQHPHDFFMELATSYSLKLGEDSSVFAYFANPGEPALGPPTFMHRLSGENLPEAPISHHWLDSTHITFGVATLGYVRGNWKFEGSAFNGREPDQFRWNLQSPRFDSGSGRITFNPTPNWSLQASYGYLASPEQLAPNVREDRVTSSATYNLPFGDNNWATTFAWGRKMLNPGNTLDAFLLESTVTLGERHTFMGRLERVAEDELFEEESPLHGRTFNVNKLSLGYIHDVPLDDHLKFGIGGIGSLYALPSAVDAAYGNTPASFMVFVRLKIF
jgi:hypothetical protein